MSAGAHPPTARPTTLLATLLAVVPGFAAPVSATPPDAARGEQVYARCSACHALAVDRVGPRHCGLVGRRAGSVPGFAYSRAMQQSQITWNEQTLDRFLAAPMRVVPGTAMTYDGVPEPQDRADLIAFLRSVDETPVCRTK